MFVIGTAGHVDHGKSALVQALTGINPDRLAQEQERALTIDLGFAWLTLPSGRDVSVVDVPGHEDFIRNMLAGIGGIDLGILVVAADEAVMPQTREHLAILDLLRVPRSVVALTKCDLIDDPDWLDLVTEEVREQLAGTVLESAPIVPVSAKEGTGLDALLQAIDAQLDSATERPDLGRPRLPIDRSFAISGFGTVVTGTLHDGALSVGESVEVLPAGLSARIRGLECHKQAIDTAEPGARIAVNLSGISSDALARGQVVAHPGTWRATQLVDLRLRVLADSPWPVRHNMQVEFFASAFRTPARIRLLDADELPPGGEGWAQARLESPLVLSRGDGYVLRMLSPSVTLGGGQIIQPHPARRHKRHDHRALARLEALASGDPERIVLSLLGDRVGASPVEIAKQSGLTESDTIQALASLIGQEAIVDLQPCADHMPHAASILVSSERWTKLSERIASLLQAYVSENPLRMGMPREQVRSELRLPDRLFDRVVDRAQADGTLLVSSALLLPPDHAVTLTAEQSSLADAISSELASGGSTPPSLSDVEARLGPELLQYLVDSGRLVKASDSVIFEADSYRAMRDQVVAYLRANSQITVADCRDLMHSSRRYAMGLLETLDRQQITKRLGDARVLRAGVGQP